LLRREIRLGHAQRLRDNGSFGEPHVIAVGTHNEKLEIDKAVQELYAGLFVEAPETLCLRAREPQAGHLEVLAADSAQLRFLG